MIDQPGTSNNTVPSVVHSNLDRPLTPKISVETATTPKATSFPSNAVPSCYLCDEQNPGDFSPTTKYLETCLLCARPFCPVHKAVQYEKVCNIQHSKYYHVMLESMRDAIAQKSPDGTARRVDAEDEIHEAGIFPSLGERDKVLFRTSPVSPGKEDLYLDVYRCADWSVQRKLKRLSSSVVSMLSFLVRRVVGHRL